MSRVDGRWALVHRNRRLFQARVVAVNVLFFCLWALLFSVFSTFFLRNVEIAKENYASLGIAFSVCSVLLYQIFRLVANGLTEAENHREESSWETSILLKKWLLTVIVQCAFGFQPDFHENPLISIHFHQCSTIFKRFLAFLKAGRHCICCSSDPISGHAPMESLSYGTSWASSIATSRTRRRHGFPSI